MFLLDINVLLALAWPNHQFHQRAHSWFSRHGKAAWGTCAVTQLGFVRLSSNPAFTPLAKTPREAADLLMAMTQREGHFFLDSQPSLVTEPLREQFTKITGHKQITDAYLIAICQVHRCKLATFDHKLMAIAPSNVVDQIEMFK